MNQKKAKQIRQALKKMKVDPTQKIMMMGTRKVKSEKGIFDLPGTFYLKKDCGRKVYQLAKVEAKSHGFSK